MQAQLDLPYLPTPHSAIAPILSFLNKKYPLSHRKLIDLGAGDGRVLFYGAETYQMHATGYEINHDFAQKIREEIKRRSLKKLVYILEKDFYNVDLHPYNVIFCFFLPSMFRFLAHLFQTINPGTFLISIRWPLDKFADLWEETWEFSFENDLKVWIYTKNHEKCPITAN